VEKYSIREATIYDVPSILDVYNTNTTFLNNHIGYEKIDDTFILNEMKEMKTANFLSCVFVDNNTKKVIGVIDYKSEDIVYLSLIMLPKRIQGNGMGSYLYRLFEQSMRNQKKQLIRIDVVNDYPTNVVLFWEKHGFIMKEETTLSWGKKRSTALIMLKSLDLKMSITKSR
jgi:L-amino acid N-acyltransferase YncA